MVVWTMSKRSTVIWFAWDDQRASTAGLRKRRERRTREKSFEEVCGGLVIVLEVSQSITVEKGMFLWRLGFCECRLRLRTELNTMLQPRILHLCISRRCTVL